MGDTHVLPIADLREHQEIRQCLCRPTVEIMYEDLDGQHAVVTHHSYDGREYFEPEMDRRPPDA